MGGSKWPNPLCSKLLYHFPRICNRNRSIGEFGDRQFQHFASPRKINRRVGLIPNHPYFNHHQQKQQRTYFYAPYSRMARKSDDGSPHESLSISKFAIRDLANTSRPTTKCDFSPLNDKMDWVMLTQQEEFKNWLKICLGLKVCLDFLAPLIQEAVLKSYEKFETLRIEQNFEPFTASEVEHYRKNPQRDARLRYWVEEIMNLHRYENFSFKSRVSKFVLKNSDATKWMSAEDGPWEIARVYMTRDFSLPPGNSVRSFDASALLRYIDKCKISDYYIGDIQKARQIAYIRNDMMHCPGYKCSQTMVESSFRRMYDFINDYKIKTFRNHDQTVHQLDEVKKAQLTILVDSDSVPPENEGENTKNGNFLKNCQELFRHQMTKMSKENNTKENSTSEKAECSDVEGKNKKIGNELSTPVDGSRYFGKTLQTRSEPVLFSAGSSERPRKQESDNRKIHTDAGTSSALPAIAPRCSAPINNRKRKFEEDTASTSSYHPDETWRASKRRREGNEPSFEMQKRTKSTKSGNQRPTSGGTGAGGSRGFYQKKLQRLLTSQNKKFTATFEVELKNDLYYGTVNFQSLFAAINQQPRCTEEDAIEAAAIQALMQQGIYAKQRDPCKSLDTFCRKNSGLPPVYHVAPFSSGTLYISTLQIFNKRAMEAENKIYLQTTVSKLKTDARCPEQVAARLALIDGSAHKMNKLDYKKALNEYCLMNGATLPYYQTHLYNTTVTSLVRKKLTMDGNIATGTTPGHLFINLPNETDEDEIKNSKKDDFTMNCSADADVDMLEAISLQPTRCAQSAEESAAHMMLENLFEHIPELRENSKQYKQHHYKHQLRKYSEISNWPVVYHTDKIISKQKLYDCVVVSSCLNNEPFRFHITCDSKGRTTAHEARENAARKSLFMLGLEHIP